MEREFTRRGVVRSVTGTQGRLVAHVELSRAPGSVIGPLQVPLAHQYDIRDTSQGSTVMTWELRIRPGDTVVVVDVGAVPDTELLISAVYRS